MPGTILTTFDRKTVRAGDHLVHRGQVRSIQAIRFDPKTGEAIIGLGFGEELRLDDGDPFEVPAPAGGPAVATEVLSNIAPAPALPNKAEAVINRPAQPTTTVSKATKAATK
jgi:hypothetical protein